MVSLRSIFIVALLSVFVMLGVGCSGNEPPNQISGVKQDSQPAAAEQQAQDQVATTRDEGRMDSAPAQTAQQETLPQIPKTIEISGMVEQVDDGIVIVTDLGKYNVVGQDLSALVGKTVNVTGAVEEAGGQYTINVLSFSESE